VAERRRRTRRMGARRGRPRAAQSVLARKGGRHYPPRRAPPRSFDAWRRSLGVDPAVGFRALPIGSRITGPETGSKSASGARLSAAAIGERQGRQASATRSRASPASAHGAFQPRTLSWRPQTSPRNSDSSSANRGWEHRTRRAGGGRRPAPARSRHCGRAAGAAGRSRGGRRLSTSP